VADTQEARFWPTFIVVAAGIAMVNLDLFVANVALPSIGRAFHGAGLADLSWVLNGYSIIFAALLVPAGRAADLIGRRAALQHFEFPQALLQAFLNIVKNSQRAMEVQDQRNLTVRQMYEEYAGARGQRIVLGTPNMIVDQMEEWFTSEATDGFLVQPAVLPEGLTDFVELVMPEIVRRGLFRSEYTGKTLRENLGLNVPVNRYLAR